MGAQEAAMPRNSMTWKVSCNLVNLRKQFAEGFFRGIFVTH